MENQEYVIGQPTKKYDIPQFIVEPSYCAEQIVYKAEIEIEGVDGAVTLEDSTFYIEYDDGLDIAGDEPEGETYPITVVAELGD